LINKIRFYVKGRPRSIIPFDVKLPLDLQKYIIEQNLNIYEILDFCSGNHFNISSVCDNPNLWKLLAQTRLTQNILTNENPGYIATKENVIRDLKKVEYLLQYAPDLGKALVDPIQDFANFDIVLQKLRSYWDSHANTPSPLSLIYDIYADAVMEDNYSSVRELIWGLFGKANIGEIEFPETKEHKIKLFTSIIANLTDNEFDKDYEDILKRKYDNDLFLIFLEHIHESMWEEEIEMYNEGNETPIVGV
jgi:hypothetical protein